MAPFDIMVDKAVRKTTTTRLSLLHEPRTHSDNDVPLLLHHHVSYPINHGPSARLRLSCERVRYEMHADISQQTTSSESDHGVQRGRIELGRNKCEDKIGEPDRGKGHG